MLQDQMRLAVKRAVRFAVPRGLVLRWKLFAWRMAGKAGPLPWLMRQRLVKEYASRFDLHVLVETGTYLGDMVAGVSDAFDQIYSIELDHTLYARARRRFSSAVHVHLLQGDSGKLLPSVLARMSRPCLFWLDAHYCGGITSRGDQETPIARELECILSHNLRGHVILIDDASGFNGTNGYPTLDEVGRLIDRKRPDLIVILADDIIRIHDRTKPEVLRPYA
jgi:hypothetical protein